MSILAQGSHLGGGAWILVVIAAAVCAALLLVVVGLFVLARLLARDGSWLRTLGLFAAIILGLFLLAGPWVWFGVLQWYCFDRERYHQERAAIIAYPGEDPMVATPRPEGPLPGKEWRCYLPLSEDIRQSLFRGPYRIRDMQVVLQLEPLAAEAGTVPQPEGELPMLPAAIEPTSQGGWTISDNLVLPMPANEKLWGRKGALQITGTVDYPDLAGTNRHKTEPLSARVPLQFAEQAALARYEAYLVAASARGDVYRKHQSEAEAKARTLAYIITASSLLSVAWIGLLIWGGRQAAAREAGDAAAD